MNKILSKPFLKTLFITQNQHHKHAVLGHTLKVVCYAIKAKQYKFIIPALLHDIGKPYVAYQDEKDLVRGTWSFTNHEEFSWYIIRNWFLPDYAKLIVRNHYLIRDIYLSNIKRKTKRYNRLLKRWNKLDDNLKKDLEAFLILDDLAKQ